jgi:hypothetical protein
MGAKILGSLGSSLDVRSAGSEALAKCSEGYACGGNKMPKTILVEGISQRGGPTNDLTLLSG